MHILEYGNINTPTIILVHGFLSPYQIWDSYIAHYKDKYHILIPILPGHDIKERSEFFSFEDIAKDIETYCLARSIHHIYAIYGMSMGGVLASYLWENNNLTFEKVILESSPLLPFNKFITYTLTNQYLAITKKARERKQKVLQKAINSMVREDMLDVFLTLIDNISDQTIKKYLHEVGQFSLPTDINTSKTQVIYLYGGSFSEFVFKKVANYIKKNFTNSEIICLKKKGHCEDALLHPNERIKQLDKYI